MFDREHWARLIDPRLLFYILKIAELDPVLGAAIGRELERRFPRPPVDAGHREFADGDASAWE